MKKLLLVGSFLLGTMASGQNCSPDTVHHSMATLGYPTLEWSGLWVNGEAPSFACDSTQPMMNLSAVVGQPFEATMTAALGDTFPSGGLLVQTVQSAFLYTTAIPSWLTWDLADSIVYPGSANLSCIKLSGTPSLADTTYYISSVGVESGFWTSWFQVTGTMFGFPAIDTFGFCHNVRVFKDYTGIDDLPMPTITLSPNPASDYVHIVFNQAVVTEESLNTLHVYNIIGNDVGANAQATSSNAFDLDISRLPAGNYWLTMDVGKGIIRREFIISR